MGFDELLAQVLELLQREGRVSYRALKRRLSIDDEYLEDLKTEIIRAKRLAQRRNGCKAELLIVGGPLSKRRCAGVTQQLRLLRRTHRGRLTERAP